MNSKKMKYGILSLMSIFMVAGLVGQPQRGQQSPPIPDTEQIENMVDELAEILALTDQQKSKIQALYSTHFTDVNKLMGNSSDRPDREAMEKLKTEFENQIKNLLTDKQIEDYLEFMASKKPQGGPPRDRRQ